MCSIIERDATKKHNQDVHRAAHLRGGVRGGADPQVRVSIPAPPQAFREPLPVPGVQGDGLGVAGDTARRLQGHVLCAPALRQPGLYFACVSVVVVLGVMTLAGFALVVHLRLAEVRSRCTYPVSCSYLFRVVACAL